MQKIAPPHTSLEPSRPPSRLAGLDGIRAIAACLVVLYHAGIETAPASLGVLAFFVLSGFLITWLLIQEEETSGGISLKNFYIRRSFRIFPAYYAYILILVVLLFLARKPLPPSGQLISCLFYVNNYYQAIVGDPNTGLSHTWSLAIEEQFYLLWPMLFIALRSNHRRLRFLSVLIPLLWCYRLALVLIAGVHQGYIYEAFDTRADHILAGCWLAVAMKSCVLPKTVAALQRRPVFWIILALLTLDVALQNTVQFDYRDIVAFIAEPILVVALIVHLLENGQSLPGLVLNSAVVRYIGGISYSIYLYQQLVMHPLVHYLAGVPLAVRLIAIFVVVFGLASVSFFLIERPFLRIRLAIEKRMAARRVTASD